MHHEKTLLIALALMALAGCSSTHETIDATTGVYDLSIASEADPCSPMRATGPMGAMGVIQQGAVLTVTAPDLTSTAPLLLSLTGETGFAEDRTEALAPCTNATLDRSYTVVGANASGFDVAYHESWTGLSTCGAAMRYVMPAAPTSDCSADLVLHYRLASPCASPCRLQLGLDGSAACHC